MEITIPDWAEKRRVYVFLGRECYMIREPNGSWWKKTVRCNLCGKCCMNLDSSWRLGLKKIDGVLCCKYLEKKGKEWLCQVGGIGPFSCCRDVVTRKAHPDCVIKYEKIS